MTLIPIFKYYKFFIQFLGVLLLSCVNSGFSSVYAQKSKPFLVVLDAGHGGKDPGKIGYRGAKEKDVALSIVLKTGKVLEAIPGIKVIYTRKSDVFVDLWKRGDIANAADADLFVSVHCNAHHTSKAIGAETWVLGLHANERNFRVAKAENEVILQEKNHEERYHGFDPKSPTSVIGLSLEQEENLDQSLLLATLIQEEFTKRLKRVNRGVKQAGFVVLYQTYMPSVLIETGFLTNRIDGKYLFSKAGQKQMSISIAKSINDYYQQQQLNVAEESFIGIVSTEKKERSKNSASEIKKSNPFYYKVQIASSKRKIATYSYNFKGFKNVERVKVDRFYKYYLGKFNSENKAKNVLKIAKNKGYKSAFVVPFNTSIIPKDKRYHKNKRATTVLYKVQLASGRKRISTRSSNFKGLKEVSVVKVGSHYKYYLGKTSSYQKAEKYLKDAKSKKYKSSFIVAFLNNKRIPLKEALKMQRN